MEKLRKFPGVSQIPPAELIQVNGHKFYNEILKIIVLIWNKQELSQEQKKYIIAIYKKGDNTD